jgi:hypothetical protein
VECIAGAVAVFRHRLLTFDPDSNERSRRCCVFGPSFVVPPLWTPPGRVLRRLEIASATTATSASTTPNWRRTRLQPRHAFAGWGHADRGAGVPFIYDAFAGSIVLVGWLWLTNIAPVFGAELNAEIGRL